MSTSNQKFVKGVVVKNDADLTKQIEISVSNTATTNTKTILQSSQTANRTINLPDSDDTLATEALVNNHINDTSAAHAASAISNTPSGNLAATDVQAALNELQSDVDSRVPDSRTINSQALTSNITLTTDNVQESGTPTNKYFTDARAKAAAVADAIVDAVTDVAPSQNAVFDALAGKEPTITAGTTSQYFRGDKTFQTLDKTAVGLSNVDNVQQIPMSYLDTDGNLAANSDSKVATQKAVKAYADSIAAGFNPKASVRAVSTVDIGGSYATTPSNGRFTGAATSIDGVTLVSGDRVLLKNQGDAKQNGIYVYNGSGQFTRSSDMDGSPAAEVASGDFCYCYQGSTYSGFSFVLLGNGVLTLNTDNLNWTASSGTSGGANATLSNLTSPTAINQDLLPDTNNTRTLGSSSNKFSNIYVTSINGGALNDSSTNVSIDPTNRKLYDNTGTLTSNLDYSTYPKVLSQKSQISGGAASAPSGSERDVYYDSTTKKYYYYNGTSWLPLSTAGNFTTDRFSGTGSQTAFTLSVDPGGINNTNVFVEGIYQEKNTYTVVGTTLTFGSAPPSGTGNIEVVSGTTVSMLLPNTTKGDLAGYSTTAARLPVGTDGQILTADSSASLGLSYQPSMTRNYIINGNMSIAQRGTSFPLAADITFPADRFVYYKNGTMVHTLTNSNAVFPTFAQSGYNFTNSILVITTTGQSSIGSGNYSIIRYNMEGLDYKNIHSRQVTLSFWVQSSVTGIFSVGFRNGLATRSYVSEYTINSANTWEKKTITLTLDTTGTWAFDNTRGVTIDFILAAGSNLQTSTLNSWQASSAIASTNQVNACNTGGTFYLTGVMLNEGSIAMPFQTAGGSYQQELAMCQRYYFKDTTTGSQTPARTMSRYATTSEIILCGILPVPMRIAPTVSLRGSRATDWQLYDNSNATNNTGIFSSIAKHTSNPQFSFSSGTFTAGVVYNLQLLTTSGGIDYNAEL